MIDELTALAALLPLAKLITLRQAVDAGVHEKLGWDAYALKEGANPDWPALSGWKAAAIEAALPAILEALAERERYRVALVDIASGAVDPAIWPDLAVRYERFASTALVQP